MAPEDRTPPFYHWSAADAALTFTLAIATFLLVPIFTGAELLGIVLAETIALAGVPILVVRLRGVPLAAIGLVRPPARAAIGAAIIGASLWFVAVRATEPWSALLGDHGEAMQPLQDLVEATPLAALIGLSLVPAICEEIATRGLLAIGLRSKLGPIAAVAISAAIFALMHLSLVRALPTAMLGATFAILAVRTGSVVPGMIAHALNNFFALAISSDRMHAVADALDAHPDAGLLVCVALVITGGGIAWGRPPYIRS